MVVLAFACFPTACRFRSFAGLVQESWYQQEMEGDGIARESQVVMVNLTMETHDHRFVVLRDW